MSAPSPPGTLRVTSQGDASNTKLEVLGADGQWVLLRGATSFTVFLRGPRDVVEAHITFRSLLLDHFSIEPPNISWSYDQPREAGNG